MYAIKQHIITVINEFGRSLAQKPFITGN